MPNFLKCILFAYLIAISFISHGASSETITTREGKTYYNVEILNKTTNSLEISYSKNIDSEYKTITTLPFSKLTQPDQKKYGFDCTLESDQAIKNRQETQPKKGLNTAVNKNSEAIKDTILKAGKPVINKNSYFYLLDGKTPYKIGEDYKTTV